MTVAQAQAGTCSIMIEQHQEVTAFQVGQAIDSSMLASRDLELTKVQDVGSEQFDFSLSIEASRQNTSTPSYVILSVSSQKLLNLIYGPSAKKCDATSDDFFSTFSFSKATYKETAQELIQKLPPCEVLKEIEKQAILMANCQ